MRIACIAVVGLVLVTSAVRAESVKLAESVTDERVFKVGVKVEITGRQSIPSPAGGIPKEQPLTSKASFSYEERRLPGTGREAEAFRSVRHFNEARVDTRTGDFPTTSTLRQNRRLIVTDGRREGSRQFCPGGPLTFDELQLIQFPADSLLLLALLHDAAVEPGEVWKPSDWVLQFLTGLEAVEKTALNCKLESVKDGVARVQFSGEVSGADLGAPTVLRLSGFYLYDVAGKFLKHAELTQEESSEAGVLNPAYTVAAKAVMDRAPLAKSTVITDALLKAQPLEADPASLLLVFEQPNWGVRFHYDRDWHIFNQNANAAVFRMMQSGSVVAQFQISPYPTKAAPGEHVAPEKLKGELQKLLKDNFQEFAVSEAVKNDRFYQYRVVAVGGVRRKVPKTETTEKPAAKDKAKEKDAAPAEEEVFVPYQWLFNLLAAPDGRQLLLTFIVESDRIEKFGAQDASIVGNLEFLPAK